MLYPIYFTCRSFYVSLLMKKSAFYNRVQGYKLNSCILFFCRHTPPRHFFKNRLVPLYPLYPFLSRSFFLLSSLPNFPTSSFFYLLVPFVPFFVSLFFPQLILIFPHFHIFISSSSFLYIFIFSIKIYKNNKG